MRRFFFHMIDGGRVVEDDEGSVLPSVVDAIQHATQVAMELGRHRTDLRHQEVHVTDEDGKEVFRMPIGNVP